ncbi:glycosyltransferase family 4 protein [Desulfococcaceae bacterium HSG7]|nr:glycosyltransferase family 4 protein [Desulfococcaceae bacterium HSG7]
MQQLKILFNLLGDRNKASSRVRGFWMAEELEKRGMTCSIVSGPNMTALLRCLTKLPGHDVIYFQKNCSKWHVRLMAIANLLGKKTLFDLDDFPSRIKSPVTLRNAGKMMSQASAVVVGSQVLLDYAKKYQPNSFLLPTSVKLENYSPAEKVKGREPVCLGWIGNGTQYGEDLIKILSEPLKTVGSRLRVRFNIVGACGNKHLYDAFSNISGVDTIFIDHIPWSDSVAVRNQLAEFDIGLYPVLNNEYNRYKCGFKALEYMAMQIPVIASPVGVLGDMIQHGKDGYLASTDKEWGDALCRLMADIGERQMMGKNGRMKVEKFYDLQKTAKYLSTLIRKNLDR